MSTQQPSAPPPQGGPYYGGGTNLPPIPVPNPEFVVYVVALLVLGLIALIADSVVVAQFVSVAMWLTAAYLVARGLAKLGNVHENR